MQILLARIDIKRQSAEENEKPCMVEIGFLESSEVEKYKRIGPS